MKLYRLLEVVLIAAAIAFSVAAVAKAATVTRTLQSRSWR